MHVVRILLFSCRVGPSASCAGPSAGKWALIDVAHNDTRSSAQRLSEKMIKIRQVTARASSVSETSDHSSQEGSGTTATSSRAGHSTSLWEQLLQEKYRELAAQSRELIALRSELEGKTKELAAHNTEVWRIPANKVITGRRIGKGGWGEVLEGTVSVAVKRLFAAIVNPRHPNMVQFIGAVFDQSPPLIIHRASIWTWISDKHIYTWH